MDGHLQNPRTCHGFSAGRQVRHRGHVIGSLAGPSLSVWSGPSRGSSHHRILQYAPGVHRDATHRNGSGGPVECCQGFRME
jgi:hypothetical protein